MDKMLYGILVAVVVIVVGFALFPTVVGAINNANLSAEQEYLGTLCKTLYILGISLISVVIVFLSVKSLKGGK
jgi:hypothetical protein